MTTTFKQSMEIGVLFKEKYYDLEKTSDWSDSEECSTIVEKTILYAKTNIVSLECALDCVMKKIFTEGFDTVNDHMWDDYCKGFLAGIFLGKPTNENLNKVKRAENLWKDPYFDYYQEVLEEVK